MSIERYMDIHTPRAHPLVLETSSEVDIETLAPSENNDTRPDQKGSIPIRSRLTSPSRPQVTIRRL